MTNKTRHQIVIVGGGTAGITVAARLRRHDKKLDVAIVEPSDKHYYQPLWTLVGGGIFDKEVSQRDEAKLIPRNVHWLRDAADEFYPDENYLTTKGGKRIEYDYLVVAPGIKIDWDRIKGLPEAIGKDGVCSNYSYRYVDSTWEAVRNFSGGDAIFTQPAGTIKCGGAPQKILYLAEDYFRRHGVRDKANVIFASAGNNIFGIEKYRHTLEEVVRRKQIDTHFRHNLIELRQQSNEAIFEQLDSGETVAMHYDMIHVTPPMSAPDVVRRSPLADDGGWVDVDRYTLQHVRYENVFGLGDASNLPTAKTGAAIRKQAPVLVKNMLRHMRSQPLTSRYNGYTSCPVVTGYGSLVLAEFDYDKQPAETFPFDQSKERYTMWLLKKYGLPAIYWHGMLKGRL